MKFIRYFKYIFLLIFLIPTILGAVETKEYVKRSYIVKNGIATEGTIIDYSSNTSVNDVDYYKIEVKYIDENRVEHVAWTGSDYQLYEFEDVYDNNETIIIVYDPKTFEISKPSLDVGPYIVFIVFLVVFGLIFLIGFAFFIKEIVLGILESQAKHHGIETEGHLISCSSNVKVNNEPIYCLKYSYLDNTGKEHIVKTKSIYRSEAARFFETKQTFKVRYTKNAVAITEKIDPSIVTDNNYFGARSTADILDSFMALANKQQEQPEELLKICEYCGSQVDEDTSICPHCSSNEFKYIAKKKSN